MNNTDELNLWYENQLVGYLWRNDLDRIGFRYEKDWINNQNTFPISVQLPLTEEEYSPDVGKAHRFFANLLPEGQARTKIVNSLKIANSDFELLREIGGECAGAFNILPFTREPNTDYEYEEISDRKLEEIIKGSANVYNFREGKSNSIRLSLAGAQDKCAVLVKDEKLYLPKGEAPSTHIIKFQVADLKHVPTYETFLTQLAIDAGLPSVDIKLQTLGGTAEKNPKNSFVLIKRYDRYEDGEGNIHRLHQEDFCQGLGFGHEKKYQGKDGPSFSDCLNLIRKTSDEPAADIKSLLHWQIFNFLAGNSDGHAKNISLLYQNSKSRRLAPFYDLVCTRAIERIDTNLALAIGGKTTPGDINKNSWIELSNECDLGKKYVLQSVKDLADFILNSLPKTLDAFQEKYGEYKALQRVEQVIKGQCTRTLKNLNS